MAALLSALESATATFDPKGLGRQITPFSEGWTESETESVVSLLMTLNGVCDSDSTSEQLAQEICDTLKRDGVLKESECPTFANRLVRLLSVNSVDLSSKASELFHEHSNVFESARIISDVRPVFGKGSASESIAGVVVVNTLKIKFFDRAGSKDIYIGLDEQDIEQVRDTVNRAFAKTKAIKQMVKAGKITNLGS